MAEMREDHQKNVDDLDAKHDAATRLLRNQLAAKDLENSKAMENAKAEFR
jgi:hypothetical protein